MNIYRIYYKPSTRNIKCWLYIKAKTEKEAKEIFLNNMNPDTIIDSITEAMEHQIVRSDITLNFAINFEKDYVCG